MVHLLDVGYFYAELPKCSFELLLTRTYEIVKLKLLTLD